jgi:uncharacterized protein YukE
MTDSINSYKFNLDQLEAMASEFQAIAPGVKEAVKDLISELEEKVDQIDSLGSELTALEETQFYKGLSEHSHQQLMLDWREYVRSLKQALENLEKAAEAVAIEKAAREN